MVSEKPQAKGLSGAFRVMVGLIGVVVLACWALVLGGVEAVDVGAALQVSVLGIAAAVAAWYAEETRRMADEAFETRKLTLQPNVHISNEDRDGKVLGGYAFYVRNYGPGVALDVQVVHCVEGERSPRPLADILSPGERSHQLDLPGAENVLVKYRSSMGEWFTRKAARSKNGWWRTSPAPSQESPQPGMSILG